jgi:hypothetical protein
MGNDHAKEAARRAKELRQLEKTGGRRSGGYSFLGTKGRNFKKVGKKNKNPE